MGDYRFPRQHNSDVVSLNSATGTIGIHTTDDAWDGIDMPLFLQCESTESKESIAQRRDWDYFVVSFESEARSNRQVPSSSMRRGLVEEAPTLIAVEPKCPFGQYYDQESAVCASCFP
jgi:hypothetical protein